MPTNHHGRSLLFWNVSVCAVYISGFRFVFPKNCEHVTRLISFYLMDSCSVNKSCDVAAVSDISTVPTWSALIENCTIPI